MTDDDSGIVTLTVDEVGETTAPTFVDPDAVTKPKCESCGGDVIVSRARTPDPDALRDVGCARSADGLWSWCAAPDRRWFGRRID